MSQGWSVNPTTDVILFLEAPAVGVNNVVVREYAAGAVGGTDAFALGAWSVTYGWPGEGEFFSDRLWFAGTPLQPQTLWATQIGDYTHHGKSTPIVDSDAVSFTINARQVNAVQDLIPLDRLIILGKGGEFVLTGGQDDVVTPSTIGVKPQSFCGSGGVQAKVLDTTAVFVQEQGQHVFDMGYQLEADGFRPRDLLIYADHLVKGMTLLRLEWAPAPYRTLWFPRSDGKMLGCTYMPEQEILGWHTHDTGRTLAGAGLEMIEDVVSLPGVTETETYVVVLRYINGVVKRYIEQFAPSIVSDVRDWFYVDSGLTYNGRNATATTVQVNLFSGTWEESGTLEIIASAALFVGASDVGDGFLITRDVVGTDPVTGEAITTTYSARVRITAYIDATHVRAYSIGTMPEPLRTYATTSWVFQRDTVTGLGHLEGRRVAILSDASVVSNGRSGPSYVVTGGSITLPTPGGVVHVGLPYRAHIETLEVNMAGGEPIRDAKKLINSLSLLLKDARGIKAGTRLDYLDELPQREFEDYGDPTLPLTGYGKVPVSAEWGENSGKVHVVSDDPLPAEILALIPKLMVSS